ncbi:unnamed protein product [Ranitomeya imitator]|uniref:DNA polymerase delta subunit 3 n=1 Tax=Ranitomeya imitator TaxID=111125 RepID=A0ABN9M0L5_9NEOB|nr:unnamed protein product [Ranitomeya imitator]
MKGLDITFPTLSSAQRAFMDAEFTLEEIEYAIVDIASGKAPGILGYVSTTLTEALSSSTAAFSASLVFRLHLLISLNSSPLKYAFIASQTQKAVDLSKDDLLGDLLQDLKSQPTQMTPPPVITLKKKRLAGVPLNPFSMPVTSPPSRASPANRRKPPPVPKQEYDSAPPKQAKVTSPKKAKLKQDPGSSIADVAKNGSVVKLEEAAEEEDEVIVEFDDGDFDEPMEEDNSESKPDISAAVKIEADIKKEVKEETDEKPHMASAFSRESCWDQAPDETHSVANEVQVDSSLLPLVTGEDGDPVFRFYWLDAYEDQYNQPGVVYLFGKVWIESAETFVSCCVSVKNIERTVYLLPRETFPHMTASEFSDNQSDHNL